MLTDLSQTILDGILFGLILAVLAVGLDLVFGLLRIVNFAYGDFLMAGLFAAYFGVASFGLPIVVAGILAVLPPLLLGVLLWLGLRPLEGNQELQMLATLAGGILLQEGGNLIFGARSRTIDSSFTDGTVTVAGLHATTYTVIAALACAVVAGYVVVATKRTRFGLSLRAFSSNETAAKLYGLDPRRIAFGAIVLSSVCIAVAATALLPSIYVSPTVGISYTLLAYIAVIIGGSGTVVGAIAGGVIVQLVLSVGTLWLPGTLANGVVVLILLVVLATRPAGLFGAVHRVA